MTGPHQFPTVFRNVNFAGEHHAVLSEKEIKVLLHLGK